VWSRVHDAFQACTKHDPTKRPNASQVLVVLHAHGPTGRHANDVATPKQKSPERSHLLGNPARTPSVQWYAGEQGEAALKHVFDELTQIAHGDINISRNKATQDVSMSFMHRGQAWVVSFPRNFPSSKASLTRDGEERGKIGGDSVESAVRRIIGVLISSTDQPSPHRWENPPHKAAIQWYSGEEGEADLKYVFDELTRIADGEVKMSRTKDIHDVTLSLERQGQTWKVKFPSSFPKSKASLIKDGEEQGKVGGVNVKIAVRSIVSRISSAKDPALDMFGPSARKDATQWYVGDQGEAALKYVFDEITKIADGEVKMSRTTDTQDVNLSFERQGQTWQVKFPYNFPRSFASLIRNGGDSGKIGGGTVETATSAITDHIAGKKCIGNEDEANVFGQPARRTPVQWYAGEHGEAALKYVFDALRQISDHDVRMSRKLDTQDVTMIFKRHGQEWQVDFPSNFPSSGARLTLNEDVYAKVGCDTLETAVSAIKNRISSVDQAAAKTVHRKAVSSATN